MLSNTEHSQKGNSAPSAVTRLRLFAYMLIVVSTVLASVLSVLLILGASITHIAAILLAPMAVGVATSVFLSAKGDGSFGCIEESSPDLRSPCLEESNIPLLWSKQSCGASVSCNDAEEPSTRLAAPCVQEENMSQLTKQKNRPPAWSIPGDLFDDFIARVRTLTPTESEVFRLHGAGKSSSEITAAMFFTINTLKMHNKHIYEKLCISSKGELLLYIGLIRKSGLGESIFQSGSCRAPLSEG